jgi:hypothetical protein
VSSVGDLEGSYIKESLKLDEKGSVRLPHGGNVVSCVEREAIRTTRRRKEKKRYQQQHVTAGAPTRKSVPFQDQPRRTPYNSASEIL